MTTALDLIKRLARELADRIEDHGAQTLQEQVLLSEVRAFCDGAVEMSVETSAQLYTYDALTGDYTPVSGTEPTKPRTVTLIVRPKVTT
jgi:hypothetical protein